MALPDELEPQDDALTPAAHDQLPHEPHQFPDSALTYDKLRGSPSNLVADPSFEQATSISESPHNFIISESGASWDITEDEANGGNFSARLSFPAGVLATPSVGKVVLNGPVDDAKLHAKSGQWDVFVGVVMVKVNLDPDHVSEDITPSVQIDLECWDADGNLTKGSQNSFPYPDGTSGWERISHDIECPADTSYVTMTVVGGTDGGDTDATLGEEEILIDDVRLVQGSTAGGDLLIRNSYPVLKLWNTGIDRYSLMGHDNSGFEAFVHDGSRLVKFLRWYDYGNWDLRDQNGIWGHHDRHAPKFSFRSAVRSKKHLHVEGGFDLNGRQQARVHSGPNAPDDPVVGDIWIRTPTTKVQFFYHMYGDEMGCLQLEVSMDSGATWDVLWSKNHEHVNAWQEANVAVPYNTAFDLRFRYRRGGWWSGDCALDYITVAGTTDDFETDFGNWANTGTYNWERDSGGTPSSNTGPSSAYSGSYYVYCEASSPRDYDDEFILERTGITATDVTPSSPTLYYYDGSNWVS